MVSDYLKSREELTAFPPSDISATDSPIEGLYRRGCPNARVPAHLER